MTNAVTLNQLTLAEGDYRLTVNNGDSLSDLAGYVLDGDDDGVAGGAAVRAFTVAVDQARIIDVRLAALPDATVDQRSRVTAAVVSFDKAFTLPRATSAWSASATATTTS